MRNSMDVLRAVQERASPPNNYLIQHETAPAVLAAILCFIRNKRTNEAVDSLQRLVPDDMIQTEHVMIVGVAKRFVDEKKSLELDALRTEISKYAPENFVNLVLDGLLKTNVPDDFSLQNAVDALVESRSLAKSERSSAASIASDLLRGREQLRNAASQLVAIGAFCRDDDRELFIPFEEFLSEIRDFPIGRDRQHWNQEVLARKDEELRSIEERAMMAARQNLEAIAEWASQQGETVQLPACAKSEEYLNKKWWRFWK